MDIDHERLVTGEYAFLDLHTVFLLYLVDRRAEFEIPTILDAVGIELVHRHIGDLCRLQGGWVYQVAQPYAEGLIPFVFYKGLNVILRSFEKHEVLKVILSLRDDRLRFRYDYPLPSGLERHEFLLHLSERNDLVGLLSLLEIVVGIERLYDGIVMGKTLCILDFQPRLEPLHIQMLHDKPHRLAGEVLRSMMIGGRQS